MLQARILSANRQKRSAQKDIRKFLDRAPPPRMVIKRGQNMDGIGFETDLNYFSVCGLTQPSDNAVKLFAKDSDNVFITSSKCSKVIAEQAVANPSKLNRVLVGRNGLVRTDQSALGSANGLRKTARSSDFNATKLSDTSYMAEIPADVPLSWNDQLRKENVVVKEVKSEPKLAEEMDKATVYKEKKLQFKTLLEEENLEGLKANSLWQNANENYSYYADYTPSESDRCSQTDSRYDDDRDDYLTTQEIIKIVANKNREKMKRETKSAKPRLVSSPTQSEEIELPKMEINFAQARTDERFRENGSKKPTATSNESSQTTTVNSRLLRAQTAKPYTNWYPTTLDVYQSAQNSELKNKDRRQKERPTRHRPMTGTHRYPNTEPKPHKAYTPIVFPMNYIVAQRSMMTNENQVINVIIDSDIHDQFSSFADPREISSALSNRPKSTSMFPIARGDTAGSTSSMTRQRPSGSVHENRTDTESELWGSGGSLSRKAGGFRVGSRTGSGNEESDHEEIMNYTEGIRVQIASKAAVTNPPPAPTPEPSGFVSPLHNSPRRKSSKKVRINGY